MILLFFIAKIKVCVCVLKGFYKFKSFVDNDGLGRDKFCSVEIFLGNSPLIKNCHPHMYFTLAKIYNREGGTTYPQVCTI